MVRYGHWCPLNCGKQVIHIPSYHKDGTQRYKCKVCNAIFEKQTLMDFQNGVSDMTQVNTRRGFIVGKFELESNICPEKFEKMMDDLGFKVKKAEVTSSNYFWVSLGIRKINKIERS